VSLRRPAARAVSLSSADARALRLVGRRNVEVLRDVRRRRGHALAARQLSGKTRCRWWRRRTSPTNMGLYLLFHAGGREFGWLGTLDAVERLEATLDTMQAPRALPRHFYNWYGTSAAARWSHATSRPSTAANLAGHLMALANGCAR